MIDLTLWFLVFVRVGALFLVFPLFSTHNVPVQLRLGLGGSLALLIAPFVPPLPITQLSFVVVIQLVAVEACVGLSLGFVCRMVFYAIEFAGSFVSSEMGLQLPPAINPFGGNTQAPGMFLFWFAAMLMFAMDFHHWVIIALQKSYGILPIASAHVTTGLLTELVRVTGSMFTVAVQISSPIMAVGFAITLIFSVLGRAIPQMNVFFESYPVRTLAGLTVFGFSSTLIGQYIMGYLKRLPDDFARIIHLLATG